MNKTGRSLLDSVSNEVYPNCAQGHKATWVQLACEDGRPVLRAALEYDVLKGWIPPCLLQESGMAEVKLDSIH